MDNFLMPNMNKKALYIALMASVLGCSGKNPQKEGFQIDMPIAAQSQTLDSIIKKQVADNFEIGEPLKVKKSFYDKDNFPFDGYRTGNYLVVSTPNDELLLFFSQKGKYIGQVTKSPEKNGIWVSQKTGTTIREGYRDEHGKHIGVYTDHGEYKGKRTREFRSREVYRFMDGQFVKEDYGQQLLDNKEPGMYFVKDGVSFKEAKGGSIIILEEIGRFYNVQNGSSSGANVRRNIGQNVFSSAYSYGNEKNIFNKVVPSNLRQK